MRNGSAAHYSFWIRVAFSWLSWSLLFAILQSAANSMGFEHMLRTLVLWPAVGQPRDVFSFTNTAVPRIIGYAFTSAPAALLGLLVYVRRPLTRSRIDSAVICVTICANWAYCVLMASVNRGNPAEDAPRQWALSLFVLLIVCSTGLLAWSLNNARHN
jgi:hypothetical protein